MQDVAERCEPATTPQTIGRLETGMRTVSVGWLNRIADALDVTAADLVRLPARSDLPVAAVLGTHGVHAPRRESVVMPPKPGTGLLAVTVEAGVGEYRTGDEIWCERVAAEEFGGALNRDVLLPRPAGRFLFGRLVGREDGKLHLVPLGTGGRQQVVADPPWMAIASRLVRAL